MKQKFRPFVGFYHYGVILTYLSVISAIVGICFSVGGNQPANPLIGVICLMISCFCDSFDGIVARTRKNRTREDKMFGERIDSLSDLIAFGVAPVMIGFGMGLNRWYFFPVYALFVLCALIRLAYFDVTEQIRMEDENCGKRTFYEGLPVTCVGFILPVFYFVAQIFSSNPTVVTIIMISCYVMVAIAYVIKVKLPKFGLKSILITAAIFAVVLASLILLNNVVK